MPNHTFVHVRVGNPEKRAELVGQLKANAELAGRVHAEAPLAEGDVVVLLSSETSPFECLSLSGGRGAVPVILAGDWSTWERDRYLASGAAAYLMADCPETDVIRAVQKALAVPSLA